MRFLDHSISIRNILKLLRMPAWDKFCFINTFYHTAVTILLYKPFFKKIGTKVTVYKPIRMTPQYISLGSNITILHHSRIEGIDDYAGARFDPHIIVNDNVTIQQNLHLTCAEKIFIGENTAIAANVSITDINHRYVDVSTPPEDQPLEVYPVSIGQSCKIYNNAVILPGTQIGRHCVIGANSVVSGCFDDFSVILGMPAVTIKRYNAALDDWIEIFDAE